VKQVSFLKLLKDSQILEDKTGSLLNTSSLNKAWRTVSEQEVNLLLSKEMNNPQIKALDFQSFLNMLVKIAILLQSKRTSVARIRGSLASSHATTSESQEGTNPKEALESLLSAHVMPLLENIEQSIKLQKQSSNHISSITLNGQYIANVSIDSLQEITLSEEDILILRSLRDVFRTMYDRYMVSNMKNENILKSLFRYLKDFEVSPYLINTKTAFMIYYFTCLAQSRPEEPQVDIPGKGEP
jgi:hypothetical protein